MVFHFAYPNVLPRKGLFIGCGRYVAALPDNFPVAGYSPVPDAPASPNKTDLKRAVQLLAPESYDSEKNLFHRQDQANATYQGDSLDLAWFLAHVLRAYNLRCKPETDIWATGVIRVDGSGPHLLDVDPTGFSLKLQAFLDADNHDLLFIVPLANVDPMARRLCAQHGVSIVRLGSTEGGGLNISRKKTILAVPADGLPRLLSTLFCLPVSEPGPKKNKSWLVVLLFLLLISAATFANRDQLATRLPDGPVLRWLQEFGFFPPPPPPPPPSEPDIPEIVAHLEQGEFSAVPQLSHDVFWSRNKELWQLRQELLLPLKIQGIFDYMRADNVQKSCVFPTQGRPPTLTHRDFYRLRVKADSVPDSVYLYIFQVDSGGALTAIFPSKQFGTGNPLRPWQWPVNIPAAGDKWIFLDRLPDSAPSPSREIIYLLAGPWPARDIETLSRDLQKNPDDEAVKAKILARLISRKGKFPAICCLKWSFLHGR